MTGRACFEYHAPPLQIEFLAGTGCALDADALLLEKEFYPEFTAQDLVSLPNYYIYLKLMIEGVVSRAFRRETVIGSDFGSKMAEPAAPNRCRYSSRNCTNETPTANLLRC